MRPILPCDYTPERITLFWSRVDRSGEHWLWVGPCDPDGYGRTGGFTGGAHRMAWFLATGEDPGSKHVLHTCDIKNCVRNDDRGVYLVYGVEYPRVGHLFLGDAAANAKDWSQKYRTRMITPMIIDAKIAEEICALYYAGGVSQFQLARRFNVSIRAVNDAVNYRP
jgi:hypothetical protein